MVNTSVIILNYNRAQVIGQTIEFSILLKRLFGELMKTSALAKSLENWRFRYEKKQGDKAWQDIKFLSPYEANSLISDSILNKRQLLAGKIGSNEQILMLWASGIPIDLPLGLKWKVYFSETSSCATNAGVKPRTEKSYYQLHSQFMNALAETDILGVFKLPREKKLWKTFSPPNCQVCTHIHFTPFFSSTPWSKALAEKRVFVVSPFLELFRQQMKKRHLVWKDLELLPELKLDGYAFPYLIDDSCPFTWQDTYQDVLKKMHESDFDVALFGCGALGLPLAHEAKRLGKVGIHLGGTLQLLFGVTGKRYEKHAYFNQYINKYWIKPDARFCPKNFNEVEGGCYW